MPTNAKSKLLLPALVLALLLALPAAAQAMLSYVRNPLHPTIFVADDDGSNPRKIGLGSYPHVGPNPDGPAVAYLHEGAGNRQELKLSILQSEFTTARKDTLIVGFREPFYFAWSRDLSTIAALKGPELGKRKLVLVDVLTGAQRVVAQGFFSGFSFSPDSSELVYARSGSERYPPRSDVFRVPVAGGKAVQLTRDHRSIDPLWGPNEQIVFARLVGAKTRKYGPKNELYLMNPNGKGVKRLTHTRVPQLAQGLFPTDWSASGNRLLAEFEGQDVSYAVKVNPKTGAQKPVGKAGEQGFVGTALSADGKLVLGFEGGFDPGNSHDVVSIPYAGGNPKVLVKSAFEPDWSL
jgi:Tol biopolymer transport system component